MTGHVNRFLLPMAVFVPLVVILAIGIRHAPEKDIIASPLIGKPAPDFSLAALDDPSHTVHGADLRGRWYLFNVWGTWCGGCRAEHDTLLEIQRARVLPIIGLDWKDDASQARAWLAQLGNPYELVAVDSSGRTAIDYGVYGAPESFLVNPQGTVVYKVVGEITHEVWLNEILPRVPRQPLPGS